MNVFDQAARYAVKLDPTGFIAWLLGELRDVLDFVGWLDTRTLPFPGEGDRTCDTVAHLREKISDDAAGRAVSWAVPIEFQAVPAPDISERLLEYAIRLRREVRPGEEGAQKYEIAGAVINLTGRRQAGKWRTGLPRPSRAALTWAVEVRTMAQEDAMTQLADIEAGRFACCLLPWIPLMKGADRPEVIDAWKRIASTEPDSRRRSEYGALALVFAELARRSRFWKEPLKGWNMKESQQVLEWQQEAREADTREKLLRALELRFGAAPEDLHSRIESESNLPTLNRWFDLAVTAADLDAFRREL